jgi:hypothetical protein
VLKESLKSNNWYVRFNASESLVALDVDIWSWWTYIMAQTDMQENTGIQNGNCKTEKEAKEED